MSHIAEAGVTQASFRLTHEASRDKENRVYMIHSNCVTDDINLEEWQIEEEIIATKKEEETLERTLNRLSEDHAARMNLSLSKKYFCPDQIAHNIQSFSQNWEQPYREHCIVKNHLARLTWLRDHYIPIKKARDDKSEIVKILKSLDLEIAKNELIIMERRETSKIKERRTLALRGVKEKIIKSEKYHVEMDEVLDEIKRETSLYMEKHPELTKICDAIDYEGKKLAERYNTCRSQRYTNMCLRQELYDSIRYVVHGSVSDLEEAIYYLHRH